MGGKYRGDNVTKENKTYYFRSLLSHRKKSKWVLGWKVTCMRGGEVYLGGKSHLNQGVRDKKGTDCAEI